MTADDRPTGTDLFGFGDITAGSIVSASILPGGPAANGEDAGARIRAAEDDRRLSMIRVAEQAAEIGLESAPALAAAAGLAPRALPQSPGRTVSAGRPPQARGSIAAPARLPQRVPSRVPPRPGDPAVKSRRRVKPGVVVLVVVLIAYLIARAAGG
jgi:hypothetical protein